MNKKILIVEDEPSLQGALAKNLSNEGFLILEADNGKDGLASALQNNPDLILLDIVMPVMDGLTMLEKLRESERGKTKAVPVIILTNLSSAEDVEKALKNRAHDYLVKSDWKLEEIVKKIRNILEPIS